MSTDAELIEKSRRDFDLAVPLTVEELMRAGMLGVLPGPEDFTRANTTTQGSFPVVREQELEDESFAPAGGAVDAVAALVDSEGYNARYDHYVKCQAIVTLAAFAEGWAAFNELVLKAYVDARRRDDTGYRGDDPQKAFSLRMRAQAAEDFYMFVRTMVAEAATVPKPILVKET